MEGEVGRMRVGGGEEGLLLTSVVWSSGDAHSLEGLRVDGSRCLGEEGACSLWGAGVWGWGVGGVCMCVCMMMKRVCGWWVMG